MSYLYKFENNKNCCVTSVPNIPLLSSLGIFEGANLFKKRTFKCGGPVLVVIGTREVAIGKDYAKLIEVKEIKD